MGDYSHRAIDSKSAHPQILLWHWDKQNFGLPTNITGTIDDSKFFKATQTAIDNGIVSLNISKSIDTSSATFDFTLLPTENWKARICPGDWLGIFMSDKFVDGSYDRKNLLILGNVDRVTQTITRGDEDRIETRYNVSGRNFGKVLEDTEIWYDPYTIQTKILDTTLRSKGLNLQGNPTELVDSVLKLFLGPGIELPDGSSSALGQWRIPIQMAHYFGAARTKSTGPNTEENVYAVSDSEPVFYDILRVVTKENLPGFKNRQTVEVNSNGSVWDLLLRSSNRNINELVVEETRIENQTVPTIRLRPRPISTPFLKDIIEGIPSVLPAEFLDARKKGGIYDLLQEFSTTLQELAFDKEKIITIDPSQVKETSLGKDDHSRFNLLWLDTQLNREYNLSYEANLEPQGQIGNPTFQRQAIQRHGLRKIEGMMEFCHQRVQSGAPDIVLMKTFLAQMYDFHFANHLYEAGSIECHGILEAELGKALVLDSENDSQKIFYIEGYEHRWSFPNLWTTSFTVTHGQFFQAEGNKIFIDVEGTDAGQPDVDSESIFRAQTQFVKEDKRGNSSQLSAITEDKIIA